MKYRKVDDVWLIVLSKGDKVVEKLTEFVRAEGIQSGYFSAIGALGRAELGHFNPVEKKYHTRVFDEPLEIVSLMGTVTYKDADIVVHAHLAVGTQDMNLFGGHLKEAVVSVTCEIIFNELKARINRAPDKATGLNLITP